jgi:hypothetical protein
VTQWRNRATPTAAQEKLPGKNANSAMPWITTINDRVTQSRGRLVEVAAVMNKSQNFGQILDS